MNWPSSSPSSRPAASSAPPEAGSALAERARALLSDYDQTLVGASQAAVGGVLRITAPVQFGRRHVAPLVSAFLNEYSEVRVELSLNDRNVDLIEEGLDLAVRIGPQADSSLVARQAGSVRRVVVASPQSRLPGAQDSGLSGLGGENLPRHRRHPLILIKLRAASV